MTDVELQQLRDRTYADVQDENGIDVTQIDELLAMTPTERLRALEEFNETLDALDKAREKFDAAQTTRTP
ncbi:MAG TPA: hypothetical protein VHS31_16585 [Tepidisphaeraceae bacterium]|jgi:hypothetical protein|nr:hypothetical protein [Tepidisphaeraceae bacterium]